MPFVLRHANGKDVLTLTRELRASQAQALEPGETELGKHGRGRWVHLFLALPGVLRRLLLRVVLLRNPFRFKRAMGTVIVTAVGMFGCGGSAWGIHLGVHP